MRVDDAVDPLDEVQLFPPFDHAVLVRGGGAAWADPQVHRYGSRAVTLQGRMVRVPLFPVEQADMELAIRWLDQHWCGGGVHPHELRDVAAVA